MLRLRKAKKRDYAAVERLLQQLQQIHIAGRPELYGPAERCLSKPFFESLIANEEAFILLAEEKREVIGVCIVSLLNHSGMVRMKTAYVNELVVDAQRRRQGVGRALLNEAEKHALVLGAKRLDLTVWSFNSDAIRVYERCGMTPQRIIYEKPL